MNPWDVASLADFSFFCCPECVYRSSDYCNFKDHALDNHPLSKIFFQKHSSDDNVLSVNPLTIKCEVDTMEMDLEPPELKEEPDADHEEISDNDFQKYMIPCPICGEGFANHNDMNYHRDNDHKEFNCADCGRVYSSFVKLMGHVDKYHLAKKCKCGKKITKTKQVEHMKTCTDLINDESSSSCLVCSEEFENHKALIDHLDKDSCGSSGSKKAIGFLCPVCSINFSSRKSMIHHRDNDHDQFPCEECDKVYPTYLKLSGHVDENHIAKICKCGKKVRKTKVKDHICPFTSMNDDGKIRCLVCSLEFTDEQSMLVHQETDHKKFSCKECGRCFKTWQKLQDHQNNVKPGQSCSAELKCPACQSLFHSQAAYREHVETEHTTWPCEKCPKVYDSLKKLNSHHRARHQYKVCESCGKDVPFDYIKEHLKICRSNKNDKKFQCSQCPFKTHNQIQLKNHVDRNHKNKSNTMLEGVEIDENGILTCPMCSKKVTIRRYVLHYKNQHGTYPPGYPTELIIKCDKCFDEFTKPSVLRRHLSVVHNIGPKVEKIKDKKVTCDFCGKIYNAHSINRHKRNIHGYVAPLV